MEFWKSWEFWGALFGLLAFAAAIIIPLAQKRRKRLSYVVHTLAELVSVRDSARERVQILFDGKPVVNPYLCLLTIHNSGNVEIPPSDFEKSPTISFGDRAVVLDSEVTASLPDDLDPKLSQETNRIVVSKLLLNPGERFTVKALVSRPDEAPALSFSARVKGAEVVRTPILYPAETRSSAIRAGAYGLVPVAISVGTLVYGWVWGQGHWVIWLAAVITVLIYILLAVKVVRVLFGLPVWR